jgi:hypothetical protein
MEVGLEKKNDIFFIAEVSLSGKTKGMKINVLKKSENVGGVK